jgi:hypothetical protein
MDSTAQTAPAALEIINETVSTSDAWIRHGKKPLGLRNNQQTTPTGDALIGQPKQLLGTEKSSTKVLPRVRYGFNNANNP